MAKYRFSVGTLQMGGNDIGTLQDCTVSYDGSPEELRGGDYRLPLAIELGDMSVEITATAIRINTYGNIQDILDGAKVDVVLGVGKNSGGLVGTIAGCKLVSHEISSAQTDYVTGTFTFRQIDPGSDMTKQTS